MGRKVNGAAHFSLFLEGRRLRFAVGDRVEIGWRFEWRGLKGKRGSIERWKGKGPFSSALLLVRLDEGRGCLWFEPEELRKLSILELIAEAAK